MFLVGEDKRPLVDCSVTAHWSRCYEACQKFGPLAFALCVALCEADHGHHFLSRVVGTWMKPVVLSCQSPVKCSLSLLQVRGICSLASVVTLARRWMPCVETSDPSSWRQLIQKHWRRVGQWRHHWCRGRKSGAVVFAALAHTLVLQRVLTFS